MWAIAKKDFKSLFYSPIGYIVVAVFLASMGIIMYMLSINSRTIEFNYVYNYLARYSLPIIVGLITMKSFSEEKSKDTEKILFSASKNMLKIIFGKIIAVMLVIIIAVSISFFYCLLFSKFGSINSRLFITIFCFLLLSFSYTSIGVMISSFTENQIVSAIITIIFLLSPVFLPYGKSVFSYLALSNYYAQICEGRLSIATIIVFISIAITSIALAVIENKRNRKYN